MRLSDNTTFMDELHRYYAVWQEFNFVYEEWAKAHRLSVNSLFVLSTIYEGGEDCTQKKISQKWLIPKQTTNMILKDFESKKLVELFPMPEDKRNKQIRLTEAGKDYASAILSELREVELFVVEKMGLERMRRLNEDTALFVEFFSKAKGGNTHEQSK